MCGIAGIYNLSGEDVERPAIDAMNRAQAHRGPDGDGIWIEGSIGFAHRRLSVIDLSEAASQPMVSPDGNFVIVYNGEVYNFPDLREELERRGRVFRSQSDTEVLLQGYSEWGEEVLERLNGMFAFALWDRRKRRLFCARDRMGIKPFYFAHTGRQFYFSSEIKALVAAGLPVSLEHRSLAEYLVFGFPLEDRTFLREVSRLAPGHCLIVDPDGEIKIRQYWHLQEEPGQAVSEEEAKERIRWLLSDAVRIHLRSDVPLGCHLSGGIDSSTVTCLAARFLSRPVQTFTGAFREDREFDEREYAREAALFAGAEYHEILPSPDEVPEVLPRLVWFMDEPVVGPGLLPQYFVSRLASRHVKVVLGGQGGDELFGGYPRYLESIKIGEAALCRGVPGRWFPPGGKDEWCQYYDRYHGGNLRFLREVFTTDFLSHLRLWDAAEQFRQVFDARGGPLVEKVFAFDQVYYLPGLLHVEDRTSMAVSLESRVPILDHRLVEFAASLPCSLKMPGGELKGLLRRAMRGLVPDVILDRSDKKGFPTPLSIWFRGPLRRQIEEILLDTRTEKRGFFRTRAISRLLCRLYAGEDLGTRVWYLIFLELWFRIFLDGENPV